MLIRKAADLTYVDVTPKQVYLNRRRFLEAMGIVGATAIAGRRLFELAAPSETALAASTLWNQLRKRRSSHSTAITIPARCPRASGQESSFLMSKACAWTRR